MATNVFDLQISLHNFCFSPTSYFAPNRKLNSEIVELLNDLAPLSGHKKTLHLISLGHLSSSLTHAPTLHLLTALASSPRVELQYIALASNWGHPSLPLLKKLFFSTHSPFIRKGALRQICLHGNEREVLEALTSPLIPPTWQLSSLKYLRKSNARQGRFGRQRIIDKFLLVQKWVYGHEAYDYYIVLSPFRRWLYLGSFELVSDYLNDAEYRKGMGNFEWAHIATTHPDLVVTILQARYEKDEGRERGLLVHTTRAVLGAWLKRPWLHPLALRFLQSEEVDTKEDLYWLLRLGVQHVWPLEALKWILESGYAVTMWDLRGYRRNSGGKYLKVWGKRKNREKVASVLEAYNGVLNWKVIVSLCETELGLNCGERKKTIEGSLGEG